MNNKYEIQVMFEGGIPSIYRCNLSALDLKSYLNNIVSQLEDGKIDCVTIDVNNSSVPYSG